MYVYIVYESISRALPKKGPNGTTSVYLSFQDRQRRYILCYPVTDLEPFLHATSHPERPHLIEGKPGLLLPNYTY